jgi:hypothetical protein
MVSCGDEIIGRPIMKMIGCFFGKNLVFTLCPMLFAIYGKDNFVNFIYYFYVEI